MTFSRVFVMGVGIEPTTLGLKVNATEFACFRVSSRTRTVERIRIGCSRLVERALVDPALTRTLSIVTSARLDEFRSRRGAHGMTGPWPSAVRVDHTLDGGARVAGLGLGLRHGKAERL